MSRNFHNDHKQSQREQLSPWWQALYKKAFPNFHSMEVVTDLALQKTGIDRIITLDDGHTITIEEKVRYTVYPDILLEYRSTPTATGWINKPLHCDYIAYVFEPNKTAHILPYQLLRRAWLENNKAWLKQYKHVPGRNQGYTSMSVAIPIRVLKQALYDASLISFASGLDLWYNIANKTLVSCKISP